MGVQPKGILGPPPRPNGTPVAQPPGTTPLVRCAYCGGRFVPVTACPTCGAPVTNRTVH